MKQGEEDWTRILEILKRHQGKKTFYEDILFELILKSKSVTNISIQQLAAMKCEDEGGDFDEHYRHFERLLM